MTQNIKKIIQVFNANPMKNGLQKKTKTVLVVLFLARDKGKLQAGSPPTNKEDCQWPAPKSRLLQRAGCAASLFLPC